MSLALVADFTVEAFGVWFIVGVAVVSWVFGWLMRIGYRNWRASWRSR